MQATLSTRGEQEPEYRSQIRMEFAILRRIEAEQESNFFYETGAGSRVLNKIVTSHFKFFESKTEVYQELESINFLKPGVTAGAEVKTLKPEAKYECKKNKHQKNNNRFARTVHLCQTL